MRISTIRLLFSLLALLAPLAGLAQSEPAARHLPSGLECIPSLSPAEEEILNLWISRGYALEAGNPEEAERVLEQAREEMEAERIERIRISGELQAAREIQMGMLPDPGAIEDLPANLDFYALLEPAQEVGGDLYDAFMIDDRHFFFLVGDVAGKGVAASLFMALSKTLCKSKALQGRRPLNELIGVLNREMSRENPAMLFVTAVAGIIDAETGELELCSAGHEGPVLLRPGAPAPQPMDPAGGPPLCALEGFEYEISRSTLAPGERLLLLSDGVTEAQDPAQALYGRKRVEEFLGRLAAGDRQAEGICRGLYEDVLKFAAGAPQSDDITIMVVGYNGRRP